MPRVGRIVIPGLPHHITQRGNNRQDVFFVEDDRRVYLGLLAGQAQRHGLAIHGYCLMTNHVHLIATPATPLALAKALGRTHFLYTLYINRFHGRLGHLWQNRFFSCALDEGHFRSALCYVERNPVRAKMVRRAWTYPSSSAAEHVAARPSPPWLEMELWSKLCPGQDWKESLMRPEDAAALLAMRRHTHTGRPLAGDSLLSRLEAKLGRRLRALPVGRPPMQKQKGKKINR